MNARIPLPPFLCHDRRSLLEPFTCRPKTTYRAAAGKAGRALPLSLSLGLSDLLQKVRTDAGTPPLGWALYISMTNRRCPAV